ncbi:MAG: serine hydrolase domain-containing protein [Acetobacteraceae bacterium]
MPETYPLAESNPAALGFTQKPLDHLDTLIRGHIAEGRYAGAQITLARHGKLALFQTYGNARTEGSTVAASNDTLFLLFSQTKVLTSAAVWTLVEEGKLSFMDRVADHLPDFAANGKGDITIEQVMTHQGGFPSADVTQATWTDHALMRQQVCNFSLEWTPGSRLQYHGRSAHLVQAMVIEACTGQDYRDVIRTRVIEPLGLGNDVYVGVPESQQQRCADTYAPEPRDNSAAFRAAGLPSGGGYATARGMAAFYQALGHGGKLGNVRLFSPRLMAYVARNHTGESPDHAMTMIPMHRGLGPHVRGSSDRIRGLGTIGAPETFGHGGVGSSYSWADPTSGVSFTYLTNYVSPDPWHSMRLDRVANLVHAAID